MNNPLRTPEDYELFLYTLTERFPAVHRSTVMFVRRGTSLARVAGEMSFTQPNIPALIQEITEIGQQDETETP